MKKTDLFPYLEVQVQGQTFTVEEDPGDVGSATTVTNADAYVQSDIVYVPSCREASGLQDGGSRKVYSTGAMKEDCSKTVGKGAYHLLPPFPIRKLAEVYRKGAIKYADRNWEKGIPLSRFMDSLKRHVDKSAEGMLDEDHEAQALWNLVGLIHTREMIKRGLLPEELDDLPSYGKDGVAVEIEEGVFCSKWRKPGKGCKE